MWKNRINYWTCSKFADWLRGEKKPYALEFDKWEEWKEDQRKKRPWRFWLSDTLLGKLQDIIYYPSDIYFNLKNYVRNRWIDKTHYLKTGFKPGYYYEFDERILHGVFNELVDFVEIELAHLSRWDKTKKYKFKKGRCIEAAYDYFKWANNLKEKNEKGNRVLSDQAKSSRKIKKIYEWWKKRLDRPCPMDASGWSKYCENKNTENAGDGKAELKKLQSIEEKYDKEDEEMLIELIKLRKYLWT